MNIGRRLLRIVALALVAAVAFGCGAAATPSPFPPTAAASAGQAVQTPTPTISSTASHVTPPSSSPSSQTQFVTPFDDSDVGCTIGKVLATESNTAAPSALTDCRDPVRFSKRVLAGGLVTTDPCGEAVLNSPCGTIYVFQDSSLRFSPCEQHTARTSSGCLADGTIAWNNTCPGGVAAIVTPSAGVTLNGTWIAATYLPDRQLSLITVLEGDAHAIALDPSGAPIGDGQDVPTDTFWFSGANGDPATVGGLDGQRAYPLDQMRDVIAELQLESWMAAVNARAEADGIKTDLPAKPVINVRAHGGGFDDQRSGLLFQNAVLLAMEWPSSVAELFPDGNGAIFALIGDSPSRNLAFVPQAFDVASKTIDDVGLAGTSVVLIADKDDHTVRLADTYRRYLQKLRLEVDVQVLAPDEAARLYEDLGAQGRPTIWLSTR